MTEVFCKFKGEKKEENCSKLERKRTWIQETYSNTIKNNCLNNVKRYEKEININLRTKSSLIYVEK
jgi:hypothetical protein